MSLYIPVFFLPISDDELPENLDNWHSVEKLLSEKWNNREHGELRTSTSRNWWHQHAISLICGYLHLDGLDFLQLEITCLEEKQIQEAIRAMEKLLVSCQDGIPELTPEMEKEGSIWFLRFYYEKNEAKRFSVKQINKAFSESCDVREIQDISDDGYISLVKFFSLLKSIKVTLEDCLMQNKRFLYVQPQP